MKRQRLKTLTLLLIVVPLGFSTKFYQGSGAVWVQNYLGGFLYVIFWMLVIFFLKPQIKPVVITVVVFSATCGIEFLQLWHPTWLQTLRSHFIGQTVLGNAFTWYDFPWYLAGSAAGYLIIKGIKKAAH